MSNDFLVPYFTQTSDVTPKIIVKITLIWIPLDWLTWGWARWG